MASYSYTFVSGDTVTPTKLNNARTVSSIVNADISNSAAIAGTKIAPDFGSQDITIGDKIIHSGDTNTAIRFPANDTVTVETGGSERMRIDASGRALIGHNDNIGFQPLQIHSNSAADVIGSYRWVNDSAGPRITLHKSRSATAGSYTVVQSGDTLGAISFRGDDGTDASSIGAEISAAVDGTPGTNDMPGRLVFSTTADGGSAPTERMRINNGGDVLIGTTSAIDYTTDSLDGYSFANGAALTISRPNLACLAIRRRTADGKSVLFYRSTSEVGSISVTTTATAYNISSDYRLKQNVEPMTGGLAKLAALKPSTFEFKSEPNVKVDGFIAHEVQAVVPQAVTGDKDGEEMQGLDMSKLVPVLVAAVQELSAKVAALEAAQ